MNAMIIGDANANLTDEIEARRAAVTVADAIRRTAAERHDVAHHAPQMRCAAELI